MLMVMMAGQQNISTMIQACIPAPAVRLILNIISHTVLEKVKQMIQTNLIQQIDANNMYALNLQYVLSHLLETLQKFCNCKNTEWFNYKAGVPPSDHLYFCTELHWFEMLKL